jgi:hypothetical protein
MKGRQGRLDRKRIPTFSRLAFDADDKRTTCTVRPRVTLIRSEKSKQAWKPSRCGVVPILTNTQSPTKGWTEREDPRKDIHTHISSGNYVNESRWPHLGAASRLEVDADSVISHRIDWILLAPDPVPWQMVRPGPRDPELRRQCSIHVCCSVVAVACVRNWAS